MRETKGAVTLCEYSNCKTESSVGFEMPRPPKRTGKAKRSLSTSVIEYLFVSAGIK